MPAGDALEKHARKRSAQALSNAADYALVPQLLKHAKAPKIKPKYDKSGKHIKDELIYKINHGRGWTLTLTRMVGDDKRLFIATLFDDLSDL